MRKQRFISAVIALVLVFTTCSGVAWADASDMLRSSPTLTRYGAVITEGDRAGRIVITYDVLASHIAESVGVSSIKIYKSGGSYVTTIYATERDGERGRASPAHWAA